MNRCISVAVIGLDTSHSVAFTQLNQGEKPHALPSNRKMVIKKCMTFPTPFQQYPALSGREQAMRDCGVIVTADFAEAVAGCDAIMIEINDPALHREYFERCAALGKPIFLDKPLADTEENGDAIFAAAARHNVPFFTASPLRFSREQAEAQRQVPRPVQTIVWGPLGQAPAGSSIVWYGVHAFEMLEQAMGPGAQELTGSADAGGYVFHVTYPEGRRGVVLLTRNDWRYGGLLRDADRIVPFAADGGACYPLVLEQVAEFFHTGAVPVSQDSMQEVMRLLQAADTAAATGRRITIIPGSGE